MRITSRDVFWAILMLKCTTDISSMGNGFRVTGHITEKKNQVNVSGSLAVVRHGDGDAMKDQDNLS